MRKGWEYNWNDFLWLLAQCHEFDLACQRWQQQREVRNAPGRLREQRGAACPPPLSRDARKGCPGTGRGSRAGD